MSISRFVGSKNPSNFLGGGTGIRTDPRSFVCQCLIRRRSFIFLSYIYTRRLSSIPPLPTTTSQMSSTNNPTLPSTSSNSGSLQWTFVQGVGVVHARDCSTCATYVNHTEADSKIQNSQFWSAYHSPLQHHHAENFKLREEVTELQNQIQRIQKLLSHAEAEWQKIEKQSSVYYDDACTFKRDALSARKERDDAIADLETARAHRISIQHKHDLCAERSKIENSFAESVKSALRSAELSRDSALDRLERKTHTDSRPSLKRIAPNEDGPRKRRQQPEPPLPPWTNSSSPAWPTSDLAHSWSSTPWIDADTQPDPPQKNEANASAKIIEPTTISERLVPPPSMGLQVSTPLLVVQPSDMLPSPSTSQPSVPDQDVIMASPSAPPKSPTVVSTPIPKTSPQSHPTSEMQNVALESPAKLPALPYVSDDESEIMEREANKPQCALPAIIPEKSQAAEPWMFSDNFSSFEDLDETFLYLASYSRGAAVRYSNPLPLICTTNKVPAMTAYFTEGSINQDPSPYLNALSSANTPVINETHLRVNPDCAYSAEQNPMFPKDIVAAKELAARAATCKQFRSPWRARWNVLWMRCWYYADTKHLVPKFVLERGPCPHSPRVGDIQDDKVLKRGIVPDWDAFARYLWVQKALEWNRTADENRQILFPPFLLQDGKVNAKKVWMLSELSTIHVTMDNWAKLSFCVSLLSVARSILDASKFGVQTGTKWKPVRITVKATTRDPPALTVERVTRFLTSRGFSQSDSVTYADFCSQIVESMTEYRRLVESKDKAFPRSKKN